MGIPLRYLQLGILLLLTQTADAKPTILVKVEIDRRDRNLLGKLERDLKAGRGDTRTPEQFLADTFLPELSVLGMFSFVSDRAAKPDDTLTLFVTSGDDRERYPARDVVVQISLTAGGHQVAMPLFRRAGCSTDPGSCAPETLADPTWYRSRLRALLRLWPRSLFKSVVLSRTARYEQGGVVRTHEDITEFGQQHAQLPTATFEILYGEIQRKFAFCLQTSHADWKALGRDQGTRSVPDCSVGPLNEAPAGDSGKITLVRAFLGEYLPDEARNNDTGEGALAPAARRPEERSIP